MCSIERVCDYCNGPFLLQKYFANTLMEASIKYVIWFVKECKLNTYMFGLKNQ